MRKPGWTFLLVFLSLLGCGSKNSARNPVQVTCEWLAGDNCWKDSVALVATCVDQQATCVFSADGSACTYPDGTLVSLAPPRTTSSQFYFAVVDVVIHSQGAECASLHVTPGGGGASFSLRTSAGTFSQSFSAGAIRYACPDGTIYVMDLSTGISCHLDTKLPGYALYASSRGCDGIALGGVDTNTVAMFCGTP